MFRGVNLNFQLCLHTLKYAKPYMTLWFNFSFHRSPVTTLWAPRPRTPWCCPYTSTCSLKVASPSTLYLASTWRWTRQCSLPPRAAMRSCTSTPSLTPSSCLIALNSMSQPTDIGRKRAPEHECSYRSSQRETQRRSHTAWARNQGLWMNLSEPLGCKGVSLSAWA